METILKSVKPIALIMFLGISLSTSHAMGWALSDVFKNLHTNTTTPGNFQDASAGYYSGGGMAVRTKNTAINPLSMTPPSLSTGCGGIDAYLGSFSMISRKARSASITLLMLFGKPSFLFTFVPYPFSSPLIP
jgi:conjugative transfer pilus assembly protein TraH